MPEPYNHLPEKEFTPVEKIPLNLAILYEDCKAILVGQNDHCPGCGGTAIVSLVELLEGKYAPRI